MEFEQCSNSSSAVKGPEIFIRYAVIPAVIHARIAVAVAVAGELLCLSAFLWLRPSVAFDSLRGLEATRAPQSCVTAVRPCSKQVSLGAVPHGEERRASGRPYRSGLHQATKVLLALAKAKVARFRSARKPLPLPSPQRFDLTPRLNFQHGLQANLSKVPGSCPLIRPPGAFSRRKKDMHAASLGTCSSSKKDLQAARLRTPLEGAGDAPSLPQRAKLNVCECLQIALAPVVDVVLAQMVHHRPPPFDTRRKRHACCRCNRIGHTVQVVWVD